MASNSLRYCYSEPIPRCGSLRRINFFFKLHTADLQPGWFSILDPILLGGGGGKQGSQILPQNMFRCVKAQMLKGTVQRDLSGVENRLKRSILINCKTASLYYLILKGHHHKKRKNQFQRVNNIYIEDDWMLSLFSANDVPINSI